jgi:hypothetical protein
MVVSSQIIFHPTGRLYPLQKTAHLSDISDRKKFDPVAVGDDQYHLPRYKMQAFADITGNDDLIFG